MLVPSRVVLRLILVNGVLFPPLIPMLWGLDCHWSLSKASSAVPLVSPLVKTRDSNDALRFKGVRWKVASDLRFRAAISEPKTPFCCGISGDLAQSTRKSVAIAIVRFWCAKFCCILGAVGRQPPSPVTLLRNLWFSDGPIRANRFADSRNRLILAKIVSGFPSWNPFSCESCFVALKIANRRFEAIRANRSHVIKMGFPCESIRANSPDSRCKSPGHLSSDLGGNPGIRVLYEAIRMPKFGLTRFFRSGPGKPNQRKVSSWTFHRGIPEQKFNVNRACFPKEKTPEFSHENGRNSHEFFVLALSLVWFAGATPDESLILFNITSRRVRA